MVGDLFLRGTREAITIGRSVGVSAETDWAVLFRTAFGSALASINFVGLHCYCIVSE